MDFLVLIAFAIRLFAAGWGLFLFWRQRNWHLGLLVLVLCCLSLHLWPSLFGAPAGGLKTTGAELLLSLFSLLAVAAIRLASDQGKRAEETKQESDQIYHGLFESIPEVVVLVDQETRRVVSANEAACRQYGYTREEMGALHFADFAAEQPTEQPGASDRKVPVRLHRKKNGQVFPVEFTRSEFALRGRNVAAYVIRDLTEWKGAEDRVRRHERQLRRYNRALSVLSRSNAWERGGLPAAFQEITEIASQALDLERVGIWLFDRTRSRIVCRDLYERSWRRHSAGLMLSAVDFPAYFKGLALDRVISAHDAHTDARTREFSPAYLTPNGIASMLDAPIRALGRNVGVVCNEHVGVLRQWSPEEEAFAASVADFVAMAIEADERKKTQDALAEGEERYRALYEDIPSMYFTLDTAGDVLSVNRFGLEQLGYDSSELIGQSVLKVFHPDDRANVVQRLAECLRQPEEIGEWEFRKVRRDGSVIWVREYARVRRNADNQPVVLVICDDITERKQAEEQVRQLNLELEQRVVERTAQLQAANKELESFSYSASHDLRAPLRAISGFSEALLTDYSGQLDAHARDYLERIRTASRRMGLLIDALLSFSRITRQEMRRAPVNLSEMAESVGAELQAAQPERWVEFVIESGLQANADPALMRIVLANLLGNAWKYTSPRDRARIEFGYARNNGASAYYVRDNGVGFEEDFAEALFMPFQRLHSRREFEGEGIGLTTVQRIIQRHGGRIWASGKVDQGATFYFSI
jgi:PAS domain S-box-containing protein